MESNISRAVKSGGKPDDAGVAVDRGVLEVFRVCAGQVVAAVAGIPFNGLHDLFMVENHDLIAFPCKQAKGGGKNKITAGRHGEPLRAAAGCVSRGFSRPLEA